jgi:hypothetical protein
LLSGRNEIRDVWSFYRVRDLFFTEISSENLNEIARQSLRHLTVASPAIPRCSFISDKLEYKLKKLFRVRGSERRVDVCVGGEKIFVHMLSPKVRKTESPEDNARN